MSTIRGRVVGLGARAVGGLPPYAVSALPGSGRARGQLLLNRAVRRAPRTFERHRTRLGFTVNGSTADLIQRYLYVFGVWEPNTSYWLREHLRPGDVVIDVGANVGYFSLLAAACVGPEGRVVAFEPVPTIAAELRRNIDQNGFAVEVHAAVASDREGTAEVFRAADGNIGRSTTQAAPGASSEGAVRAVRVADVVARDLWPRVRFVKVDVEGDEHRVVRGLEPLLAELGAGAAVLIELSPDDLVARGGSAEDILETMAALGFDPYEMINSYAPVDYARYTRREPVRLTATPTSQRDVLFLKR